MRQVIRPPATPLVIPIWYSQPERIVPTKRPPAVASPGAGSGCIMRKDTARDPPPDGMPRRLNSHVVAIWGRNQKLP